MKRLEERPPGFTLGAHRPIAKALAGRCSITAGSIGQTAKRRPLSEAVRMRTKLILVNKFWRSIRNLKSAAISEPTLAGPNGALWMRQKSPQ